MDSVIRKFHEVIDKGDILGIRSPMFLPLWRRVALTGVLAAWALVEGFVLGNPGWFWMVGLVAAYCAWHFFVTFDPEDFSRDT